jgi:hypothetical protein
MGSHGNRDHSAHFFSGKENDELAQRLHELYTTIKNTPAPQKDETFAFDKSEALFMRDALIIQDQLASARVRLDTSYQRRHPDLCLTNVSTGNGNELARDTTGKVSIQGAASYPVSVGCLVRQIALLESLALVLLWKGVEHLASRFGAYEVHVAWTLVGILLGSNQRALSDLLRALRNFVTAPLSTLVSTYGDEMEFQRELHLEATFMRNLRSQRYSRFDTFWTRKSGFHIRLCIFAMVENVAFDYADVGTGFGLCCLYFAWFTILSIAGV